MFNIEINNWLPRWMNYYVPNESLLKDFYYSILADGYSGLTRKIFDFEGQNTFSSYSQLSYAWTTYSTYKRTDQLDILLYTDSGSSSVQRVDKDNSFYMSTNSVYKIQDNGTLLFRNLEVKEVSIDSLITEENPIIFGVIQNPERQGSPNPNKYIRINNISVLVDTNPTTGILTVNLGEEILECTDVWYLQNLDWERVTSNSGLIDYENGTVTFYRDLPTTIRYSSKSLYSEISSGYVSINSSTRIQLFETRLSNCWDSLGYVTDLPRLYLETNCSLAQRTEFRFTLPKDINNRGIGFHICNSLNLVNCINWCPSGTLNFTTLGITGVTEVFLKEYKQEDYLVETPVSLGNNQYRLKYFPDNIEVFSQELTTISASFSENIVTLLDNVDTNITIREKVTYYTTVSSSGYITQVIPSRNILGSKSYKLYYKTGVNVFTVSSDSFSTEIFTNNQPNLKFYEIKEKINNKSKLLYNYSIWDEEKWFYTNQLNNSLNYLPRILE